MVVTLYNPARQKNRPVVCYHQSTLIRPAQLVNPKISVSIKEIQIRTKTDKTAIKVEIREREH